MSRRSRRSRRKKSRDKKEQKAKRQLHDLLESQGWLINQEDEMAEDLTKVKCP